MGNVAEFSKIAKMVFGDPKLKAQLNWFEEFGVCAQLERQWPRDELESYAGHGRHEDPSRRLSVLFEEPPDFDWWEPRHDHPWRRQDVRRRELGL